MNDDTLARLVSDAVSQIEPDERLDEIRTRARHHRSRRRGRNAAGAVALATAAAVTAFAVLGGDEPRTTAPDPAGTPSSKVTAGSPGTWQPVYFVGDAGRGPRLFSEPFLRGEPRRSPATGIEAMALGPRDPDYRTPWPADAFVSARLNRDVIEVTLADSSLRDRPAGMTQAEAGLAIQQVLRNVQTTTGGDTPVQFRYDGNPIDQVFGVPTSEPLAPGADLEVLSLMSIDRPREGARVAAGSTFTATGVNNATEATMTWRLEDRDGTAVREGFATAEGWGEDRLFPWRTEVDVSGLGPGSYTFVASNPDVSDGEGFPPDTDTRTIIVE